MGRNNADFQGGVVQGTSTLYHGTDAKLVPGDVVRPGAWGTYSRSVAGLHGNRVYIVSPVNPAEDVASGDNKSGMTVIKEVDNPHWTGECGREDCDFSDDNHASRVNPVTGHEEDTF